MILLLGIPSESPLRMVAQALEAMDQPYLIWNQRQVAKHRLDFEISAGQLHGIMTVNGTEIPLEEISGVYVRAVDDAQLPELKQLPEQAPERKHSRAQHEALMCWLDLSAARIVNRPAANASNGSKAWQTRVIQAASHLLQTPDTLISNAPDAVREFRTRHGELIYKSASGFRSIVKTLSAADAARLDAIRWCPAQFQRRIKGEDVRVHVVGEQIFATRILSSATDYRYATREGLSTELEAFELPGPLADACRTVSKVLDLPFAGVDLRINAQGDAWCFEVNPCPGFSYYESHTGQAIAAAVARYLTGAQK